LLYALLPPQLSAGDPQWLDEALGTDARQVDRARFQVAMLYAQGAVILPLGAGLVRHGTAVLAPLFVVELVAALMMMVASKLARRQGARASWWVGPAVLVAWAALAAGADLDLALFLSREASP
jgi:hypothetical protein